MTPKEKAKDLIDNFTFSCRECDYEDNAKQCAIMICDEIHEALKQTFHQVHKKTEMTPDLYLSESIAVHYYQEVKKEIENL